MRLKSSSSARRSGRTRSSLKAVRLEFEDMNRMWHGMAWHEKICGLQTTPRQNKQIGRSVVNVGSRGFVFFSVWGASMKDAVKPDAHLGI